MNSYSQNSMLENPGAINVSPLVKLFCGKCLLTLGKQSTQNTQDMCRAGPGMDLWKGRK